MIAAFRSRQFIAFLLAGGFAAIVNFGSRFAYNEFVSFGNAVLLAYLTGMVTAFVLNKFLVFEKSIHSTKKEFFYFTIVNLAAVLQTYVISVGLAHYAFPAVQFEFYPEAVAHGVGVIFPVFTSFLGHKYFSFRRME